MAELLEEQRESWGTRGGFVLAAVGSAVGLGNLWRFPYELYDHGGGAFLIPYIIAVFVIGVPMLILEFSLGHFTQRAAPDAFAHGHKRFEFVGWWSIMLGFIIISFYAVVLAWCFSFLYFSIQGIFAGGELPWAGVGLEGVKKAEDFFLKDYLGHAGSTALGPIRWHLFWPLLVTWVAMYLCIFKGVKIVGRLVLLTVPLPWLMLLVLTVRGLTLEGSMQGLAYYLNPTWSELARATTWRFAFGQAFFSLSLAFGGVMITYSSFLHRRSDLNNNAAIIGLADFATSFIAGLAVFSTLGGMAFVTAQAGHAVPIDQVVRGGAGLAFVVFPYALAQLPYSAWWGFIFFLTLVTLGIDSGFSITESILAAIVDKTGWKRRHVLPIMSLVGFAAGLVYITGGGLTWLETIGNFIDGTWGIAFLGLVECIVLGWLWRIDRLRRHANDRSDWHLGIWWDYLIRIGIPVILSALFVWSLYDDCTTKGGFLRSSEGQWIVTNCVGLAVMIGVPILAVILGFTKSKSDWTAQRQMEFADNSAGKNTGLFAMLFAAVSVALVVILFKMALAKTTSIPLLCVALVSAVAAVIISNRLVTIVDTSSTRTSWFARWAGLLATASLGGLVAIYLVHLTKGQLPQHAPHPQHELTAVSYVILSVVLLLIVGGLGWCFYKAMAAAGAQVEPQLPDEIGDENRHESA